MSHQIGAEGAYLPCMNKEQLRKDPRSAWKGSVQLVRLSVLQAAESKYTHPTEHGCCLSKGCAEVTERFLVEV